jgi:hypothetical protein
MIKNDPSAEASDPFGPIGAPQTKPSKKEGESEEEKAKEIQRLQKMLREVDKKVSMHARTSPDLTGAKKELTGLKKLEDEDAENENIAHRREAYLEARARGHLKYIYHGKYYSTRLKTESRTEHLEDILERAEKYVGPTEIGMEGGGGGLGMPEMGLEGGEMPLEESKHISKDDITRLIIEEWTNVCLENKLMKINRRTLKNLVTEEISEAEYPGIIRPEPTYRRRPPSILKKIKIARTLPQGEPEKTSTPAQTPAQRGKRERKKSWRQLRADRRMAAAEKYGCLAADRTRMTQLRRASAAAWRKQGIKKGQWPHESHGRYTVKDSDGAADDWATFNKFYKEVRKNKCAYLALGGTEKSYDYNWGDQHADAYAELNPESRLTGKVKVSIATERGRKKSTAHGETVRKYSQYGGAHAGPDVATPMSRAIEKYQAEAQKLDKRRKKLEDMEEGYRMFKQYLDDTEAAHAKGLSDVGGNPEDIKKKLGRLKRQMKSLKKQIQQRIGLVKAFKAEAEAAGKSEQAGPGQRFAAGVEEKDFAMARENLKYMLAQLADKIKKHKADPLNQPGLASQIVKLKKDISVARQGIKSMRSGHHN